MHSHTNIIDILPAMGYNSYMKDIHTRTHMLVGDKIDNIINSTVAVFGLGGVGSYAVEALARAGVGKLILIDNDTINNTNINRQLYALSSTNGQYKTDVAKIRIHDINADISVVCYTMFVDSSNIDSIDISQCNYVIDAIDTVTSKLLLIEKCNNINVPIISCMGTGNKLDANALTVADIYSTTFCPLARAMRKLLKERGITKLDVVYSTEQPSQCIKQVSESGKSTPASISYVPPVAGMLLAGYVIKQLINS